MRTQGEWVARLGERKFFLLFVGLLIYLIVYPYVEENGFEFLGFRVFAAIVILLSVWAASYRRRFALLVLGLAIPSLMQRVALPTNHASAFALAIASTSFLFDLTIVIILFRRVFAEKEPNSEAIFGALCIYLLIGFSFANGYLLVASLQPNAFIYDAAAHFPTASSRFNFVYYSFATMSALGASGMQPATDEARSLSIIQAILGLFYLAVLISRLMSLYVSRPGRKN